MARMKTDFTDKEGEQRSADAKLRNFSRRLRWWAEAHPTKIPGKRPRMGEQSDTHLVAEGEERWVSQGLTHPTDDGLRSSAVSCTSSLRRVCSVKF